VPLHRNSKFFAVCAVNGAMYVGEVLSLWRQGRACVEARRGGVRRAKSCVGGKREEVFGSCEVGLGEIVVQDG